MLVLILKLTGAGGDRQDDGGEEREATSCQGALRVEGGPQGAGGGGQGAEGGEQEVEGGRAGGGWQEEGEEEGGGEVFSGWSGERGG